MAIDQTYRKLLLEQFINDGIKSREIISANDVVTEAEKLIDTLDLTIPQFEADSFKVKDSESASVSKFNESQQVILQDLTALYKEMINLTQVSTNSFERWKLETEILEKDVAALEDRIQNLLLLAQDTEGYHSYLVDNFDNFDLTDSTLTTARLDPVASLVSLGHSRNTDARIYLNNLAENDISFKVRSTLDFKSKTETGNKSDIFKQQNNIYWSTIITMSKAGSVTCELAVKLNEVPLKLNRIFIRLHHLSSGLVITPLYSLDNFTFKQLPTNTYTQDVREAATFSFSEIQAKYIKFLLVKEGQDSISNNGSEVPYQLGFAEISFFRESFDQTVTQQFFSSPLSIIDPANPTEKIEFSKLTLEACERVEANTSINYFITASDDATVPVTDGTIWIPITPVGRSIANNSKVISLGDIESVEKGLTETIGISFTNVSSDHEALNPADSFHLLSLDADGTILDESITTTDTRYIFTSSNERILNYQIKDSDYTGSGTGSALNIDEKDLIIFRNSGLKTIDPDDTTALIRGTLRGWKFEEPYYSTVIEIQNPLGMTVDFGTDGEQSIIIDDRSYSGLVGPTVLTGRTQTQNGIHRIKVHKDKWLAITPSLTSLEDIQAEDTLYPFNHKLLIEGYNYPTNYTGTETRVYIGADVFASELMKKVSIFDLVGSVGKDQWQFFALDRDAPDTHTDGNESTKVIVIKVDESQADFPNEQFVIRFNLINQRYKYLRFRADFATSDPTVTPSLDSYKIKLG